MTYPTPDSRLNPPDIDDRGEEAEIFRAADQLADGAAKMGTVEGLIFVRWEWFAPIRFQAAIRDVAEQFVLEGATEAERAVWLRITNDPFVTTADDARRSLADQVTHLAYEIREAA